MKQLIHFTAISVTNLLNQSMSSHPISQFIPMYERLNVTNVPCVLKPEIDYLITAKLTAMLEHLNVKHVAKLSNIDMIY
jgi:hypothetical protein